MSRIIQVTSSSNVHVKAIAALALKKERSERGLFLVEGLQLVGFGIEAGWELDTVIFKNAFTHNVLDKALKAAHHALEADETVMAKVSRKDNPQSVIGVFKQKNVALKNAQVDGVWVVLEEVRDPGNLGTILRTIDAVGAQGVMLVGNCTDVWAPESVRATMGSIFHVPIVRCSREDFLDWRLKFNGQVVGTHLNGTKDYRELGQERPLMICMGTEQSGLSGPLSAACSQLVRIPMRGKAESLNLAMATGLLLYEAERQNLAI